MTKEDASNILRSIKKRLNSVDADKKSWDTHALLSISVATIALVILKERTDG